MLTRVLQLGPAWPWEVIAGDAEDIADCELRSTELSELRIRPDLEELPVSQFCFPAGIQISTEDKAPQFWCFVLTDGHGERSYAYCTLYHDLVPQDRLHEAGYDHFGLKLPAEGESVGERPSDSQQRDLYEPRSICLIAAYPFPDVFKPMVKELYLRRHDPVQYGELVACMFEQLPPCRLPPSVVLKFSLPGLPSLECFNPSFFDLPVVGFSFRYLLMSLSIGNLLTTLSCLLLERKVLLVSSNNTLLTVVSESLLALMYPFRWAHTYIPLLPRSLIPYISAPIPFLIGLSSQYLHEATESMIDGDVVVVDIDADVVRFPQSSSYIPPPPLPLQPEDVAHINQAIRRTLFPELRSLALLGVADPTAMRVEPKASDVRLCGATVRGRRISATAGTGMFSPRRSIASSPGARPLMQGQYMRVPQNLQDDGSDIRMALLRPLVGLLEQYAAFNQRAGTFDTQGFVKQQDPAHQPFVHELVQTQGFDVFVRERLRAGSAPDFVSTVDRLLANPGYHTAWLTRPNRCAVLLDLRSYVNLPFSPTTPRRLLEHITSGRVLRSRSGPKPDGSEPLPSPGFGALTVSTSMDSTTEPPAAVAQGGAGSEPPEAASDGVDFDQQRAKFRVDWLGVARELIAERPTCPEMYLLRAELFENVGHNPMAALRDIEAAASLLEDLGHPLPRQLWTDASRLVGKWLSQSAAGLYQSLFKDGTRASGGGIPGSLQKFLDRYISEVVHQRGGDTSPDKHWQAAIQLLSEFIQHHAAVIGSFTLEVAKALFPIVAPAPAPEVPAAAPVAAAPASAPGSADAILAALASESAVPGSPAPISPDSERTLTGSVMGAALLSPDSRPGSPATFFESLRQAEDPRIADFLGASVTIPDMTQVPGDMQRTMSHESTGSGNTSDPAMKPDLMSSLLDRKMLTRPQFVALVAKWRSAIAADPSAPLNDWPVEVLFPPKSSGPEGSMERPGFGLWEPSTHKERRLRLGSASSDTHMSSASLGGEESAESPRVPGVPVFSDGDSDSDDSGDEPDLAAVSEGDSVGSDEDVHTVTADAAEVEVSMASGAASPDAAPAATETAAPATEAVTAAPANTGAGDTGGTEASADGAGQSEVIRVSIDGSPIVTGAAAGGDVESKLADDAVARSASRRSIGDREAAAQRDRISRGEAACWLSVQLLCQVMALARMQPASAVSSTEDDRRGRFSLRNSRKWGSERSLKVGAAPVDTAYVQGPSPIHGVVPRSRPLTVERAAEISPCELGMVAECMSNMQAGGVDIRDRTLYMRKKRRCFIAREAVSWLVDKRYTVSREAAVKVCSRLETLQYIRSVEDNPSGAFQDDKRMYRFVFDEVNLQPQAAVADLAAANRFEEIEHLPEYVDYCLNARQLRMVRPSRIPEGPMRLCFWLNVHNAMALHARLIRPPPKASDRVNYSRRVCYIVGRHVYSMSDVYHAVLRAGAPRTALFTGLYPQFDKDDSRADTVCRSFDPRIHFALWSGWQDSVLCRAFVWERLETELEQACSSYIRSTVRFKLSDRVLQLPNYPFSEYSDDFVTEPAQLIRFTLQYLDDQPDVHTVLQDTKAKIKLKFYDVSNAAPTLHDAFVGLAAGAAAALF